MNAPERILREGCAALGLAIDDTLARLLLRHLELLQRWNRHHNLTAVRDPQQMVVRHLLDCLAVVPYVPTGRLLDLGTGAGFPGIPLALARPDDQFTLVDKSLKRVRFVRHVIAQLEITNATVLHARVESLPADRGYDAVLARAVATPVRVLELAASLLAPGGCCLVMCAADGGAAPVGAPASYGNVRRIPLEVPRLERGRELLAAVVRAAE